MSILPSFRKRSLPDIIYSALTVEDRVSMRELTTHPSIASAMIYVGDEVVRRNGDFETYCTNLEQYIRQRNPYINSLTLAAANLDLLHQVSDRLTNDNVAKPTTDVHYVTVDMGRNIWGRKKPPLEVKTVKLTIL